MKLHSDEIPMMTVATQSMTNVARVGGETVHAASAAHARRLRAHRIHPAATATIAAIVRGQ